MRKIYMLTCAFACMGTVVAQQDSIPPEISMNEVIISATRFGENNKRLAQQVQSIDAKKIQSFNQPTTAELLTHTGNVFVQKSQMGGGSPVMRGFEANKVLIVVDGVRMNNAIFRGGHLQNILSMDNSVLEKTELLFGPASVMYGSDALGGVISFYTKKPVLAASGKKTNTSGSAYTRYSSAYGELTAHASLNTGQKKWASFTGITVSSFGDLQQGSVYYKDFPNWGKRSFYVQRINETDSMIANTNPQKQKETGYKQYDFIQKILVKTGRSEQVLNLQYSTSSNIPRYDRLTETTAAGIARSAEWYYGPQKRLMAAWNINLPASSIYDKAQITTAYQYIEESRHNRNYRNFNLNHRAEKVKVATFNADFFKLIKKEELNYGAEITYNNVNSTAYRENISTHQRSALDTRYPNGGSNTQSYAAYASLLHQFSEQFDMNAGLRFTLSRLYSKFNDTAFFPFPYKEIEQNSEAAAGNIGMIFRPGTGWKISGMFSTGFRTPNVDDMSKVFESGGGRLVVPNPNIKPEKTTNFELGVHKKTSRLILSTSAWYTIYKDVLTTDFSTLNGADSVMYDGVKSRVITVVNKNKAHIWGCNASAQLQLGKQLSFFSTINYSKGRIKETPNDYPLDHIAPLFGKTSFAFRHQKFSAEVFALYNARKDSSEYNLRGEDNHVYSADPVHGFTPGWITANIRTSYTLNNHFTAQFAIENIFDKYYRVFASGLSAPGRNFIISFRAKF